MTPAPKSRWFRYSLRTLFVVVTVAAIFVGWIAHEYKTASARIEYLSHYRTRHFGWDPPPPDDKRLSFWRRRFGDKFIVRHWLARGSTEADLEDARRFFPEANVFVNNEYNPEYD